MVRFSESVDPTRRTAGNEFAVIAEGLEESEPVIVTDLVPVIQGMPLKPIHSAGMLPLLSETSKQAQVLIPLVTSIVFGLLASTLLILPALYAIMEDIGYVKAARKTSINSGLA